VPGTPGAMMPSVLASSRTAETPSSRAACGLGTTSNMSGRAASGARGGKSTAVARPAAGSHASRRPEPARHVSIGSTTPATSPHATAATAALPPASSIASAASTDSRRAAATATASPDGARLRTSW
jgi:hypothetical protein